MSGNIPGVNFLGGIFPGGSLMGGNFPGGSFPDTNLLHEVFFPCQDEKTTSLKLK